MCSQDQGYTIKRGVRGILDDPWECNFTVHAYLLGNNMGVLLLLVTIHPVFPPLHVSWLNHLRMVAQGLATPYQYSRETTQVSKATPTWVLSHCHPGTP
jgi:hypothetical protein